jgi:hypothetical protein
MQIQVIGLSGKAGTGKDWIFENYLRPAGYHRWALADHFKIWAVGRGLATYQEVFHTKPPHVRKALQQIGTEEGRLVYGESVWLDTTWAWMHHLAAMWGIDKFCVTDARFPNEVEYIQSHGGKVLRINAPIRAAQSDLTEEAKLHISETALDNYSLDKFDGIIQNDPDVKRSEILESIGDVLGNHVVKAYYDSI